MCETHFHHINTKFRRIDRSLIAIVTWEMTSSASMKIQYIPRNMHTVFASLCFVVVIHWLIFPYPSGLLHWHCGNLTIASVPAKQPWWIWINTSCEFIMNDCITTTKQSTTKPCAYFLGYTVSPRVYSGWTKPCFPAALDSCVALSKLCSSGLWWPGWEQTQSWHNEYFIRRVIKHQTLCKQSNHVTDDLALSTNEKWVQGPADNEM